MRSITLFFLIVFLLLFSSPTLMAQDDPWIKKTIVSSKTSKHRKVRETNLYIIPPRGFASTWELGMQNFRRDDNTFIIFNELKRQVPFDQTSALNKNIEGATLLDFRYLTINDLSAVCATFDEDSIRTIRLRFGGNDFEILVEAYYPKEDKMAEKLIVSSLESLCYVEENLDDRYAYMGFYLVDNPSAFKLAIEGQDVYVYTKSGVPPSEATVIPVISVLDAQMADDEPHKALKDFITRISEGMSTTSIRELPDELIDGKKVVGAEVEAQINEKNVLMILKLFSDSGCNVMLFGISPNDHDGFRKEVSQFIKAIRIK